jgi:hypothetical protein
MTNKRILLLLLVGFLCLVIVQGQSTNPATGGNASGAGGTVSYTIGQLVYTTNTGTGGSLAQGVQQPFEISVVTAIEQTKDIILICSVYPNPTTDFLILSIENYDSDKFSYRLYDINGNILEYKRIVDNETRITMGNHAPGTYFIKITDYNKKVKTFKIIKTNNI